MVPRTKHMVVVAGTLLGVVGSFVVAIGLLHVAPHITTEGTPALVISSVPTDDGDDVTVTVLTDTTREDMRKKMVRTLTRYAAEHKDDVPEEVAVDAPAAVSEKDRVIVDSTGTMAPVKLCDTSREVTLPVSWGPIRIEVAEGARVVRTQSGEVPSLLQLPLEPTFNEEPSCLPSSMIGILLDGTVVVPNVPQSDHFEGLAGYAIDGFPLFSSREDGRILTSADLDECHGHMHEIVVEGVVRSVYHYHLTSDAPYSLSCLRGTPVPI